MNGRAIAKASQRGFTLVEMLIATVIVIVGLVAVAQLVPTSVMMNAYNRNDGTALVVAQRQMEALRAQPLASTTFSDSTGLACYPAGNICNLGDPAQPKVLVGSPVAAGTTIIDFAATAVDGYNFSYLDPNDPFSAPYDIRWAVITLTNPQGAVVGKRFLVGVFRRGMKTPTLPVTLDSTVQR